MKKAVHWYCTNKPPLRNWRAYFDSPLPFWYNLLLIVASKLRGRWTLEFSGNNFAAYFYWQLHICHRFSYNKSSCISPTKQKEPLTWVRSQRQNESTHTKRQSLWKKPYVSVRLFLVHHRGLEPRTHWLRVSCSTNWANGAYMRFTRYIVKSQFE